MNDKPLLYQAIATYRKNPTPENFDAMCDAAMILENEYEKLKLRLQDDGDVFSVTDFDLDGLSADRSDGSKDKSDKRDYIYGNPDYQSPPPKNIRRSNWD